jgi:tRNA(fMet)-specific endonuclease VapC
LSFLLDTKVCIAFLNGRDKGVRDKLLAMDPETVRLCSVVRAELLYGARNQTLITRNQQEFHRIPGLRVVSW